MAPIMDKDQMQKYSIKVSRSNLVHLCCAIQIVISIFFAPLSPVEAAEPEVVAKEMLCYKCLANIYVAQKNYPDAIVEYQAIIAMQPADPLMRYGYGALLAKTDEWTLAAPQFKAAIKLSPSIPEYHVGLGNCYMQAKNYDAAAAEYKKACILGGKYENVLYMALQYQTRQYVGDFGPPPKTEEN
jgi:tetratricopeptide (TPR) repeat protein